MKTYSSDITAYRAAGKAHAQISFLSFKVRDKDTPATTQWVHFCTDEDDRTATVTDPDTGSESRAFLGGGHIVAIDPLVRSEGAVVRNHSLVLSGASDDVLDMVYGYNCRDALFQWYIGEVDQDTGLLVSPPVCEFVGFIDTIEQADGALAVDGQDPASTDITVSVVSLAAALLRTNQDMRSLEISQRRDGDEFFKRSSSAHHWFMRWGMKSRSERDKRGGGKGDGGRSPSHGDR